MILEAGTEPSLSQSHAENKVSIRSSSVIKRLTAETEEIVEPEDEALESLFSLDIVHTEADGQCGRKKQTACA